MSSIKLTDQQWKPIESFLRAHSHVYVGDGDKCRRFMEAVLWVLRTGAQWRAVPESYGAWNSIYKRFARWAERGIFDELLKHFATEADCEWLIFDSSVIRAHMSAAGAPKKNAVGSKPRRWAEAEAASRPSSM